jgi:hypothetical protein
MLTVRSEIGPYRRPSRRYLALSKMIGVSSSITDSSSTTRRSTIDAAVL